MSDPIVTFDEQAIRNDLRELVRQTVEDTLNGLLEEADDLVGAERYERTAEREAYRAGHYDRKLVTTDLYSFLGHLNVRNLDNQIIPGKGGRKWRIQARTPTSSGWRPPITSYRPAGP